MADDHTIEKVMDLEEEEDNADEKDDNVLQIKHKNGMLASQGEEWEKVGFTPTSLTSSDDEEEEEASNCRLPWW